MRLGVPGDGARSAGRRPGHLRRRQVHRLPLLHAGLPVGRRPRTGTRSRRRSASARSAPTAPTSRCPNAQRRAAHPGGEGASRPEDARARLREGLPRRRARLRRTRRDAREGAQAHRRAATASTSITSTARRRPAARASCTSPPCRSRSSASPTSGTKRTRAPKHRAAGRAARGHGVGRVCSASCTRS